MRGARNDLWRSGLLGPVFFQVSSAWNYELRPYNSSPRIVGAGKKPALRSLRLVVQDAALSRR